MLKNKVDICSSMMGAKSTPSGVTNCTPRATPNASSKKKPDFPTQINYTGLGLREDHESAHPIIIDYHNQRRQQFAIASSQQLRNNWLQYPQQYQQNHTYSRNQYHPQQSKYQQYHQIPYNRSSALAMRNHSNMYDTSGQHVNYQFSNGQRQYRNYNTGFNRSKDNLEMQGFHSEASIVESGSYRSTGSYGDNQQFSDSRNNNKYRKQHNQYGAHHHQNGQKYVGSVMKASSGDTLSSIGLGSTVFSISEAQANMNSKISHSMDSYSLDSTSSVADNYTGNHVANETIHDIGGRNRKNNGSYALTNANSRVLFTDDDGLAAPADEEKAIMKDKSSFQQLPESFAAQNNIHSRHQLHSNNDGVLSSVTNDNAGKAEIEVRKPTYSEMTKKESTSDDVTVTKSSSNSHPMKKTVSDSALVGKGRNKKGSNTGRTKESQNSPNTATNAGNGTLTSPVKRNRREISASKKSDRTKKK